MDPFLFNLYMNDLLTFFCRPPHLANCNILVLLYADDTALLSWTRVLGDFSVHPDDAPSMQAMDLVSSMVALGLSQCVTAPTHQAEHTLDLIFKVGVMVDRITATAVPWSDHHVLKACVNGPPRPCLGGEPILACPWSQMDPMQFQMALQDPMPPGSLLDELVEDWQSRLSVAIDEIAPRRPLHPCSKLTPWYTQELREMKRECRWLERQWCHARNGASRASYRSL